MAQPAPLTSVEFFFSCRNLPSKDLASKSDPMVVLFQQQKSDWKEVGRTEVIKNNPNPDFAKCITVKYNFEDGRPLKAVIYDSDDSDGKLKHQDFVGDLIFSPGKIFSSGEQKITAYISEKSSQSLATMTIKAEQTKDIKTFHELCFKAEKVEDLDVFSKSDPYLVFSRRLESGEYQAIHRTEVVQDCLNPVWEKLIIKTATLCNGDFERLVKIECFDYDDEQKSDFIGQVEVPARLLTQPGVFELVNPAKEGKSGYKNSGLLKLTSTSQGTEFSFLDYIFRGYEICQMFAVDFTISNNLLTSPLSLHRMQPNALNGYQLALSSIGGVVAAYDRDQKFSAFGFGAKYPKGYSVNHCFPLNRNVENPEVDGIEGVLGAYASAVEKCDFNAPTNFTPCIERCSALARISRESSLQKYYILLILTDGEISDLESTKRAIVQASELPMSIIIVGIGAGPFHNMVELDADKKKLETSSGEKAKRDIVQFVQLNALPGKEPDLIAEATLKEIPKQFLSYVKKYA